MSIKLSKREQAVIDLLLEGRKSEWTVEEIGDAFFGKTRPPRWRTQIAEVMRWVCAKTQSSEMRVERASPLGRGRKAVYRVVRGEQK